MHLTENRRDFLRDILKVLACGGAGVFLGVCAIIWLHTPPPKADQLRPLMKEIGDYKAKMGMYPTSCDQFASFAKLTNQFSIYTGSTNQGGIHFWTPWEVKQNDFTILLNVDDEKDAYVIFLPVVSSERRHSFSYDFSAWEYNSKNSLWRKGRIYYSSFDPYWKPSFLH